MEREKREHGVVTVMARYSVLKCRGFKSCVVIQHMGFQQERGAHCRETGSAENQKT